MSDLRQPSPDLVSTLDIGASGPRVVIKDVIDIRGTRTQGGSRALAARAVATRHAEVVQRVLDGGCRIVGKANLHELAFGMTGLNAYTGTPVNPRFPYLIPGGSSSGSATAVAARLCDWALGTDTGGSIRVPAACCGVAGLKPSFGRVSRRGLMPSDSSLDCVGPIARDAATLTEAMAVIDPTFRRTTLQRNPRVGLVATEAAFSIQDRIEKALRLSSAVIVPRPLIDQDVAFQAGMTIMNAEMHAAFGHLLATDGLGPDVRMRLMRAATVTPAELTVAEQTRSRFRTIVDAALQDLDVLALPTLPVYPAPLSAAQDASAVLAISKLVRPFNLTGHPALTLPIGENEDGPVGLQLVGCRGDDELICAVAVAIEQAISIDGSISM